MLLLSDVLMMTLAYTVAMGIGMGLVHLIPTLSFTTFPGFRYEDVPTVLYGYLGGLVGMILMVHLCPPRLMKETDNEDDDENDEDSATSASSDTETDTEEEDEEDEEEEKVAEEEAPVPTKRRKQTDEVLQSGVLESETTEAWKQYREGVGEKLQKEVEEELDAEAKTETKTDTTSDSDYVPPARVGRKRGRSPTKRMALRSDEPLRKKKL